MEVKPEMNRLCPYPVREICFVLCVILWLVILSSSGKALIRAGGTAGSAAPGATFQSDVVRGTWTGLNLPSGAVDLALKSNGAWATASSTAAGFMPDGVIDGNWTARDWGKGHGWQSGLRHHFPCQLQVNLPHEEEIDTIVIKTFPSLVHGLNWLGIRDANVFVRVGGKWRIAGMATSLAGNVRGTIVIPIFPAIRVDAIRIVILGVNTGNQEDVMYDDDDFARILQVGLYRLQTPHPFISEDVSVRVERGPLGSVAIYRDELPIKPRNPSSPDYLASVFRRAGYGVTFLNSKQLCVPSIFNRKNFDVFVQPYGAPFPVGTMLYQFLHQGGALITMGGHPFRRALMFSPEAKLVDGGYDPGITTSVSRQSDYRLPFRQQLGMFYGGYEHLNNVAYMKPAAYHDVLRASFKRNAQLRGEVATGLVGERLSLDKARWLSKHAGFPTYTYNAMEGLSRISAMFNSWPTGGGFNYLTGYIFNWPRSRWIPLVNAYDRFGNLKGAVISLMTNFRGPYRGSGWIFCGVTNVDLFSPKYPELTPVLVDALQYLRYGVGLHTVESGMDCYRQGEVATASAVVENYRNLPLPVNVRFEFIPKESRSPAFVRDVKLVLRPEATARPSVSWHPQHFNSDLYRIRVSLLEGSKEIRLDESGFVVWDPTAIARGPKVDFRDNYFQIGGRSELLVGTRYNGIEPHGQVDENALGWDRQFAQMYDNGIRVVSPVFFSSYIPGLAWGQPQTPPIPKQLLRLIDAQVQLAQIHHLIYAPCLFFLAKYLAMAQPELSRRICEELGKRYASVPGIMFYIFDDGSADTPLQSFRKWSRNDAEGFDSAGRQYVVMAETAGTAMWRYGSDAMTFPSDGTYSLSGRRPTFFRLMDMRAAGKSFQLSEFGVDSPGAKPNQIDLHTYPGKNVSGSPTGDYSVYLIEPHLLFATGGAYVVNWDWRDQPHFIFLWGLTNPDYTPKDVLLAYRDDSYFLRHFEPVFRFPKVLIVVSTERLIRHESSYVTYLCEILNGLSNRDVQFALVNDTDVDRIPVGPHVLIYPYPRYIPLEVLDKLKARVRAGDELFVAGDFTQTLQKGGSRQTALFDELLGLKWIADYPADLELPITPTKNAHGLITPYIGSPLGKLQPSGATVLATDVHGDAIISTRQLGSGSIFYTSDTGIDGLQRALDAFLSLRSVPGTPISPQRPNRPILELDRAHGGKIYTLFAVPRPGELESRSVNGPWIKTPETYLVDTSSGRVKLPLGTYGVSLFATRREGGIDAVEGEGTFSVDEAILLKSEPHVMAMSLDKAALNKSHAIGIFAIGAGKISLATAPGVDVVEVGEIEKGRFKPIEQIKPSRTGGLLTFQIDAVESRGVLLITSRSNEKEAQQLINTALH